MINKVSIITISLFILLFFAAVSYASTPINSIASVIAVRGEVRVIDQDGIFKQLHLKDPLYLNDSIDTGASGRIQILFTDNTIISLGKKSILKISDYYLAEDKTGRIKTTVTEGVFRVMGGILTKTSPDKFITKTPSGTIGIRGSMFAGQVTGTDVAVVFEGGKGITISNNTGVVTISDPGSGTTTTGLNQPIEVPYTFNQTDLNIIHTELSFTQSSSNTPVSPSKSLQATPRFTSKDILPTIAVQPGQQTKGLQKPTQLQEGDIAEKSDTANEDTIKADFFALSNQIRNNQKNAAQIFRNAVSNQGMAVDNALGAVLMGMQNSNRQAFDSVMDEALNMGFTADQARDISEMIRSSGVCK